jgi:hypothetical protein
VGKAILEEAAIRSTLVLDQVLRYPSS